MKNVRQSAFESLVSLYPARKGKGRWLHLCSRVFDIKPYGLGKPLQVGNYKIMLDPGDGCDQLFYFGLMGGDHNRILESTLEPGDTVIDLGANTGHFAASCASLVGKTGRLHLIEANPYLISRLQQSFGSHKEFSIHHAAAGDHSGTVTFSVATFSGWSSLVPNDTYDVREQISVPLMTLDELVAKNDLQRVRLLKLDIEGGEFAALRGASLALSAGVFDLILTEVEPFRMQAFSWSHHDLKTLMNVAGYQAIAVKCGSHLRPATGNDPGLDAIDVLYARAALSARFSGRIFGS
jgi:FkbM family methyltransferase